MAGREQLASLPKPVALVLAGGASLGSIQVGMLRALLEMGFEPDMIVGTSVGAINGAFMAREFSMAQLDRLEEIWRGITTEDVFPRRGVIELAGSFLGSEGRHIASKRGLEALAGEPLTESHDELVVPTTLIASDILTGEKILLSEGDLRTHMVTSASIPGVFPPVELGERVLVDGGVVANVPVLPARHLGAKSLVVLDPGYPCALEEAPTSRLGYALHIVTLMIRHQSFGVLHFLEEESVVVYVPPPCPIKVAPHNFSATDELIEQGYSGAVDFLSDLDVDGNGIYGHPHFHGLDADIVEAEDYASSGTSSIESL
jgi:NTE family protein